MRNHSAITYSKRLQLYASCNEHFRNLSIKVGKKGNQPGLIAI